MPAAVGCGARLTTNPTPVRCPPRPPPADQARVGGELRAPADPGAIGGELRLPTHPRAIGRELRGAAANPRPVRRKACLRPDERRRREHEGGDEGTHNGTDDTAPRCGSTSLSVTRTNPDRSGFWGVNPGRLGSFRDAAASA